MLSRTVGTEIAALSQWRASIAKKQKSYSRECKLEAVKLAKELGSASQTAKSLGWFERQLNV
jgi:transposase-like protein